MDLDLVSDKTEVRDTIYVAFVGFTIMIWDHIDTFTTEVECIWPRVGEKKPIVYLFLINRYLIPLGFTVNLYAYLKMDYEMCKHFVRYEGAMTMIGVNVVGLMMLIRIYALYRTRKWVVAGVTALLLVEIGTYSWLMSTGQPVQHHPEITSCTMIFGEKNSVASSSSAWLPLLYDTVVLILTLGAIVPSVRHSRGSATIYVMKRLLKDGLIYYSAIFAVTLVLSVMIAVANSGLKNITAQLELLVTVTMMSRITLNLMKSMKSPDKYQDQRGGLPLKSVRSRVYQADSLEDTGELRRPYSLSIAAPLPQPLPPLPAYLPATKEEEDRNHEGVVNFEALAFSSYRYAATEAHFEWNSNPL